MPSKSGKYCDNCGVVYYCRHNCELEEEPDYEYCNVCNKYVYECVCKKSYKKASTKDKYELLKDVKAKLDKSKCEKSKKYISELEEEEDDEIKPNNNNKILTSLYFNRYAEGHKDLNMLLIGKVSSGKTTLLNAMLGDYYSETKIQKTTKGVSLYLTNCETQTDRKVIFDTNKSVDKSIITKNIPFNVYDLNKLPNSSLFDVNIFDTPGVDDPDSAVDEMTLQWIKNNKNYIDTFVIVLDIQHAFVTKSDKSNIRKIIDVCDKHIIFAINKFDEFNDTELNEMYDKCVQDIDNVMSSQNKKYDICKISSLNEYVTKMTKIGKCDRLTSKEKMLSKLVSESGFSQFYNLLENVSLKKNHSEQIIKLIKKDALSDNTSLSKLCNVLQQYSLTNMEYDNIAEHIYSQFEDYAVLFFEKQNEINKKCNIFMRLRMIKLKQELEINQPTLQFTKDLLESTLDHNEKNIMLNTILEKEVNNLTKTRNAILFGCKSNTDCYEKLVMYGKLISIMADKELVENTLKSYINLIVVTNMFGCYIALPEYLDKIPKCSDDEEISLQTFYKIMMHFLICSDDKYVPIFAKYKNLSKLRYTDGYLSTDNLPTSKTLMSKIDFDKISQYFEYLDEVKRVHDCLYLM